MYILTWLVDRGTFAVGNMIIRASEGRLIDPLPEDRIKQVSYSWQKLVHTVLKSL